MAVADKVKSIIVEQLGVDEEEVTPDASFVDDLGAELGAPPGFSAVTGPAGLDAARFEEPQAFLPRRWLHGDEGGEEAVTAAHGLDPSDADDEGPANMGARLHVASLHDRPGP